MKIKPLIGPVLGVIGLMVFLILPPIAPLTALGMKVVGIFIFTITWWATVSIGYPSLITLVLLVVTGAMTPHDAFATSWGHYITIFILAAFGLAEALRLSGFSKRFALWFITRPFTVGRPWAMMAMFLLSCTLMGSVMNGTATCITFMAIAEPMLEGLGYKKGDRFSACMMMGISWAASVAFLMTPIGHGSNIMLLEWIQRDSGIIITFPQWLMVGYPVGLLILLLILVYFRFVIRPDLSRFSVQAARYAEEESDRLGKIKINEKWSVGIFLGVIALWLLPSLTTGLLPSLSSNIGGWGYAIPPLAGACLLCIVHVAQKPLLTFKQWMAGVPWETIALVGTILALADVVARPETGIPLLGETIFSPLVADTPFFVYLLIGSVWVVLQTNLMSNLVSKTLVYTIMMPTVIALGAGNPAALGFTIWAGATAGFALPSATTNTALVTGSHWVPIPFMAKHGFIVSIGVVLIATFVIYPFASMVFG